MAFCCFGQIQRMRLFGLCCCCLESESDKLFRLADLTLKEIPVLWFRKIKHRVVGNHPNNDSSYYLCGLGGYNDGMVDDDNNTKTDAPLPQQVKYSPYMPLNATLTLVDTRWYGPALRIASNQFVFADDDVTASNQPSSGGVSGNISDRIQMTKTIPLGEIDCATSATREECLSNGLEGAEDFVVVLKSKANGTKLLVLHVLPPGHGHQKNNSKPCSTRDALIEQINMMLTWNGMQVGKGKKDSVANANMEVVNNTEVGGDFVLMGNSNNSEAREVS